MTTAVGNEVPTLPPFPYVPRLDMKIVSAAVAGLEKAFRALKIARIEDAPGTSRKPAHQLQLRAEVGLGWSAPLAFSGAWLQLVPVERRNLEAHCASRFRSGTTASPAKTAYLVASPDMGMNTT